MSTDSAVSASSPAWRRLTRRLLRPFLFLLALLFLFEAWLWSHLAPVVAWVVARIPLREIKARVAAWIEHLPPYATLLVFLVPVVTLFPLKLVGLWMLAHGSWLGAMTTLAAAKVISTGLTAFIFDLTRDKLLQMGWFRRLYDLVLRLLARAHALVDPIKRRIKLWFRMFSPRRANRTVRLMLRIRRRMHAA
jgi:hypothetical protein